MDKQQLSEREICTQYIAPAIARASWDVATQVREEFTLTAVRIIVCGKPHTRAKNKRADYVLFYKPSIPIAAVEAKRTVFKWCVKFGYACRSALSIKKCYNFRSMPNSLRLTMKINRVRRPIMLPPAVSREV